MLNFGSTINANTDREQFPFLLNCISEKLNSATVEDGIRYSGFYQSQSLGIQYRSGLRCRMFLLEDSTQNNQGQDKKIVSTQSKVSGQPVICRASEGSYSPRRNAKMWNARLGKIGNLEIYFQGSPLPQEAKLAVFSESTLDKIIRRDTKLRREEGIESALYLLMQNRTKNEYKGLV